MTVSTGRGARWPGLAPACLCIALAACSRDGATGAAAEVADGEASGVAVAARSAEGDAAPSVPFEEPTPAQPADLAHGWLDGVWVAGGRDRYHLVITVDGRTATVVGLDGTEHWSGAFTAEPVGDGYHRVRDAAGTFELHAFVRHDDELVGILFGENGLAEARRVHPVPATLVGEWTVGFSDNYHLAGGLATFGPDAWSVRVGNHAVRSGSLYGLGERAGAVQLALQTSPRYLELANFVRTPGDTWLAWIQGTDQHMVFHRDDARPTWIPERASRIPLIGAE